MKGNAMEPLNISMPEVAFIASTLILLGGAMHQATDGGTTVIAGFLMFVSAIVTATIMFAT